MRNTSNTCKSTFIVNRNWKGNFDLRKFQYFKSHIKFQVQTLKIELSIVYKALNLQGQAQAQALNLQGQAQAQALNLQGQAQAQALNLQGQAQAQVLDFWCLSTAQGQAQGQALTSLILINKYTLPSLMKHFFQMWSISSFFRQLQLQLIAFEER